MNQVSNPSSERQLTCRYLSLVSSMRATMSRCQDLAFNFPLVCKTLVKSGGFLFSPGACQFIQVVVSMHASFRLPP
jgi:hypothetical protein